MEIYNAKQEVIGDPARVHLLQRVLDIARASDKGLFENSFQKIEILDVGCGDGEFWRSLNNPHIHIKGADRDREKIEKAKTIFKNSDFYPESAYDLSKIFSENYFDLIVSTQVFSYIKKLDKAFLEISKVMKKAGKLIFTIGCTKYRKSYKEQLKRRIGGWLFERYYFKEWDEKELSDLLKKAGFKIIDIRFYTIHPLKDIHNKIVSQENKNKFLKLWKEMEDFLGQDKNFKEKGKPYCQSIYMECEKI